MRIAITDSGEEAVVYDWFGMRSRSYVKTRAGQWVTTNGTWADRELVSRIESVVQRTAVIVAVHRELNG